MPSLFFAFHALLKLKGIRVQERMLKFKAIAFQFIPWKTKFIGKFDCKVFVEVFRSIAIEMMKFYEKVESAQESRFRQSSLEIFSNFCMQLEFNDSEHIFLATMILLEINLKDN